MEGRTGPTVAYIGGATRSGSTLVERLLGELPGVCPLGEVVHLWQRGLVERNRCGCGSQFRQCEFWRQVASAAFGGWDRVDPAHIAALRARVDRTRFIPWLIAPTRRPRFDHALEEYGSYIVRLYRAVAAVEGCGVIVDSSKNGAFAFCLSSIPDLDLRVIHLVRDSRAVAFSWTRKVRRPEVDELSYMPITPPVGSAWNWSYQNLAIELLSKTGVPTLRVRYEDLIRAPRATLARIAGFTGMQIDADRLDFIGGDRQSRWVELGVAHTASGNPMRFNTGRIGLRLDDEWRASMPPAQRWAVTALTLPLLRRYGYLHRSPVGMTSSPGVAAA